MKQTDKLGSAGGIIASLHAVLNNVGSGSEQVGLKKDSILHNYYHSAQDATP